MAMICPRCATVNRDQARFCDGCGLELGFAKTEALQPEAVKAALSEEEDLPDTIDLDDDQATQQLGVPDGATRPLVGDDTRFFGEGFVEEAQAFTASSASLTHPLSPSETQEFPPVSGMADTQQKSYSALSSQEGKKPSLPGGRIRNKKLFAILIICAILLVGAAVAVSTYSLELWGGKQVPDVVGLKAQDATERLEEAGFAVSQVLVKSDDVEGIVLGSRPGAGVRAEAGSEVVIDVSCARTIPEVVGKGTEEALALLQSEGFQNVEVVEQKSNDAAGTIIAVSPEVGTRSKAQATITLTAAIPFTVPATANLSLEEAQAALEAEGYGFVVAYVYTEDVAEGSVLGTDPAEGTELPSGSEVTINIAKSRAAEVISWARDWFNSAKTYTLNGVSYELTSLEDVSYTGGDGCSFRAVMRPFETHSWFGSQPETRYGNEQTIKGEMSFSSDGTLATINPDLRRA